ncbi:hypothetical protein CYMTET_47641 [Cymbomonas tetramitiformis]|uniref:Uncharacterized protein n=1 Tax=Cymbomonas tetramitiformis TaxID=36881 RepID=A0AAE0EWE8_9CHLO|nr:hypothetical protein CYMTET_47641 [Cymbomonas tetramitiformis]
MHPVIRALSEVMSKKSSHAADAEGCLNGTVAEVYLWSINLSEDELRAVYAGFDQTTALLYLAAYFDLEEGDGTSCYAFRDVDYKGAPARLFNGPEWVIGQPANAACVVTPITLGVLYGLKRRRENEKVIPRRHRTRSPFSSRWDDPDDEEEEEGED